MKALLIAGSTGVGKSQIAYNLAKTLGSSVITADSV